MKHIDPNNKLSQEHFCELFDQLPLTDKEKGDVRNIYWQLYLVCVNNPDVTAQQAWLATKNMFIAKETQVGERMKAKS